MIYPQIWILLEPKMIDYLEEVVLKPTIGKSDNQLGCFAPKGAPRQPSIHEDRFSNGECCRINGMSAAGIDGLLNNTPLIIFSPTSMLLWVGGS